MADIREPLGIIFYILLSSGILYYGYKSFQEAWSTREWDKVEGTITKTYTSSSSATDLGSLSTKNSYYANVEYTCVIDGVTQTGDQIYPKMLGRVSSNERSAAKYLKEYPVGKVVDVYYNPEDHTDLLLQPGLNVGHYLMMMVSLVILVTYVGIAIYLIGP